MSTRDVSDKQEKEIAKYTGGKVQSNSGGTKFGGGDVLTDTFFIEAKAPMKPVQSVTISKEWINKAREQAFEQRKLNWTLAFRFDPDGQDYFVISKLDFLALLALMEDK